MSTATAEAVAEMRARYANRVIIFDVPPVLQADDALAFARYLQAGLLVIGEGKTRRDEVTRTFQLLQDLPFVGTVLNGSREPLKTPY
jgi:Mrp family chromosome partitioning ATPase